MIKAIIFDFDGLLVDSEQVWFRAVQNFLDDFHVKWSWEHQKITMGTSTQTWVSYIYDLLKAHQDKEQILKGVISNMRELYASGQLKPMQGANEALHYCLKNNYLTGLASGSYKELLYTGVKVNGWKNYFKEIISSDDLPNGKPHPGIYIDICKKLGVKPFETVVLEDSKNGMKSGIAAGTNVIAIPSVEVEISRDVLDQCIRIIPSLHEFPKALESLNK